MDKANFGLREIPFPGNNKLLVGIPRNNRPVDWYFYVVLLDVINRTPGLKIHHRVSKNEDRNNKGGRKRKLCRVCNKRGKRKQTIYVCTACPDKPGLCPEECFVTFHT